MQKNSIKREIKRKSLELNTRTARTLLAGVARAATSQADRDAVARVLFGEKESEWAFTLIERRLGFSIVPSDMKDMICETPQPPSPA